MSSPYFPRIRRWLIPQNGWYKSLEELASDGRQGNEGIILWLGHRRQEQAFITHLFFLRGKGIIKQPDFLMITSELMNEVTDVALDLKLKLLGQVHSHGPSYPTDLSRTDKEGGITFPYYLSVVAPDYGLRPQTPILDCGVHLLGEPERSYRRLSRDEVKSTISLEATAPFEVTTVGSS